MKSKLRRVGAMVMYLHAACYPERQRRGIHEHLLVRCVVGSSLATIGRFGGDPEIPLRILHAGENAICTKNGEGYYILRADWKPSWGGDDSVIFDALCKQRPMCELVQGNTIELGFRNGHLFTVRNAAAKLRCDKPNVIHYLVEPLHPAPWEELVAKKQQELRRWFE